VKGMVLAAGFGTRLSPLTDVLPKALVPVAGKPMLRYALDTLSTAGCKRIVVNAFHHAEQIERYVSSLDFPAEIIVLREDEILGTGGGLLNAASILDGDDLILLHNADIISGFNLGRLIDNLLAGNALGALAVNTRATSRALLFNPEMRLLGKEVWKDQGMIFPPGSLQFGFCGIHALRPDIFHTGFQTGFSDIFDLYRFALESGQYIIGTTFQDEWIDLGTRAAIDEFEKKHS